MSVLRSSLIPGLLETMKKNLSQQTDTLKLFEIGKVFFATQKGSLPEEKERVAGLITGNRSDQSWYSKKIKNDFFDLKGVIEGFIKGLMIKDLRFEKIENDDYPYYKNGYAAVVKSGDTLLGSLGRIGGKTLKNYGLKQDAFVFDFSLKAIRNMLPDSLIAEPLPRFPSISRDITIIVDRSIPVGEILEQIESISKKQSLIEKTFLFDAFEGKPLPEGKKSLSFRVVYRSAAKTLKEKNIKKLHVNISRSIVDLFHADLPEAQEP
jgi:phenylalanyl-tRNA synthetase beta chain